MDSYSRETNNRRTKMSLNKCILFSRLEEYPDEMWLVCDDWHENNPDDGWPHNPELPRTVGELRALYDNVSWIDRIGVTDSCCDTCKKADFEVKKGTLHMEIY
jgi:hypothetical protein